MHCVAWPPHPLAATCTPKHCGMYDLHNRRCNMHRHTLCIHPTERMQVCAGGGSCRCSQAQIPRLVGSPFPLHVRCAHTTHTGTVCSVHACMQSTHTSMACWAHMGTHSHTYTCMGACARQTNAWHVNVALVQDMLATTCIVRNGSIDRKTGKVMRPRLSSLDVDGRRLKANMSSSWHGHCSTRFDTPLHTSYFGVQDCSL